MTIKELVSQIKICQQQAAELLTTRNKLLDELRSRCKHAKVTEWYTSHCDDWDRTITFYYKRKCLRCGLMDYCEVFQYQYNEREEKQFLVLKEAQFCGEQKAEIE